MDQTVIDKKDATEYRDSFPEGAFRDRRDLVTFEVPEGTRVIGAYAFCGCSSLKEVRLPEGVVEIGPRAFEGCASLAEITFPSTLEKVGESAFCGCVSLREAVLPDSLGQLPEGMFLGCRSLKKVLLPERLREIGAFCFSKCSSLGGIDLPPSLEKMGEGAFRQCVKIRSVTLPEGISSLGAFSFEGCSSLESVDLPQGLARIDEGAFRLCGSLRAAVLPETLSYLGPAVFAYDGSLESVSLPAGITGIGDYAFDGCAGVRDLELKGDITSIGKYAFRDMGRLEEISLPNSVEYIGEGALSYMGSLLRVILPEALTEISPLLFRGCSSLEEIIVPSGLRRVGEGSFRDCRRLEKITLPDGVEYTGEAAFAGCTALSDAEGLIIINGTVFDCITSGRQLISVGEGVSRIASGAFARQRALREVILPSTLKVIDPDSFAEGSLDKIILPENVRTLGEGSLTGVKRISVYDTLASSIGRACARYSAYSDTYDYESHTVDVLSGKDGTLINSVPVVRDGSASYRKELTEAWDGSRLDMEVFDALFPLMISLGSAMECALYRMSNPFDLSGANKGMYVAFLKEHDLYAVETVLKNEDASALDMMYREGIFIPQHMEGYMKTAEKTASTQMRAALMEYMNRLAPPPGSGSFELEEL